jgi:hypothetical protein
MLVEIPLLLKFSLRPGMMLVDRRKRKPIITAPESLSGTFQKVDISTSR